MVKVLNLKLLLRLERASRYFSAVPIELYTNDVHAHPHVQDERTRELNEGVSLSRGWQRQVGRGSGFQALHREAADCIVSVWIHLTHTRASRTYVRPGAEPLTRSRSGPLLPYLQL